MAKRGSLNRESSSDAGAIRKQVLAALAANRPPGFHFPGHLLQLASPRIGAEELEEAMPDGPHCHDADGAVSVVALGVLLDTALASAPVRTEVRNADGSRALQAVSHHAA